MTHEQTTTRPLALAAFAAVSAVATPVFAAGGGGADFPWVDWGVSVLNFVIFIGIILYFGGSKIREFFQNRREELVADLNEAKELRAQAQERLDEYSRRLESLDDEREQLLEDYREQGEREKEKLIADAKRQVEKMRDDAELVIEQEVRKAVASLEQQAVDLAVDMAKTTLDDELDTRTQNILVDQYVQDLKSLEG